MKQLKWILIGFLFWGFTACNSCKNVLPLPNYFLFSLIDSAGVDLMESTYNEPSYPRITSHAALEFISSSQGYRGYLFAYPSFTVGTTYYLELSSTETDTISLNYSSTEEKCYTAFNFIDFTYNGVSKPLSNVNEIVVVK